MTQQLITLIANIIYDIRSARIDTFSRVLSYLILAGILFGFISDFSVRVVIFVLTQGQRGGTESINIVLIIPILLVLLLRKNQFIRKIIGHFVLTYLLIAAYRIWVTQQDLYGSLIIIVSIIFLAGFLVRGKYSIFYQLFASMEFLLLVSTDFRTPHYPETLIIILASATATGVIVSQSIKWLIFGNQDVSTNMSAVFQNDKKLFSELAHRLKTPLAVLKNDIESIESVRKLPETTIRALFDIEDAVNNLTKASKLSLSKIDVGRHPTDLSKLVENCVKDAKVIAKNYERTHNCSRVIEFITTSKTPYQMIALISEKQIREAVLNLIDNSIRHNTSKKDLTILVSIRRAGRTYLLTISDDGEGIDLGKLSMADLEPETESRESSNQGIGIQIVRNIIRNNSGRITFQSHPGVGTMINIWIPIIY